MSLKFYEISLNERVEKLKTQEVSEKINQPNIRIIPIHPNVFSVSFFTLLCVPYVLCIPPNSFSVFFFLLSFVSALIPVSYCFVHVCIYGFLKSHFAFLWFSFVRGCFMLLFRYMTRQLSLIEFFMSAKAANRAQETRGENVWVGLRALCRNSVRKLKIHNRCLRFDGVCDCETQTCRSPRDTVSSLLFRTGTPRNHK